MIVAEFWKRVDKTDGCWFWLGQTNKGYGRYSGRGAHRLAYELTVGPVPEGLELDHLCNTPICVRPDHLEPVTRAENNRRRAALTTHCPKMHPFDQENTYYYVTRDGHSRRNCRACNRASRRASVERRILSNGGAR